MFSFNQFWQFLKAWLKSVEFIRLLRDFDMRL